MGTPQEKRYKASLTEAEAKDAVLQSIYTFCAVTSFLPHPGPLLGTAGAKKVYFPNLSKDVFLEVQNETCS